MTTPDTLPPIPAHPDAPADIAGTGWTFREKQAIRAYARAAIAERDAEIARLFKDRNEWKRRYDRACVQIDEHAKDIATLRAEVAALRVDAERYQALRNSGHMPPDQFDREVDAARAAGDKA